LCPMSLGLLAIRGTWSRDLSQRHYHLYADAVTLCVISSGSRAVPAMQRLSPSDHLRQVRQSHGTFTSVIGSLALPVGSRDLCP
jgi:phosphate-selective porin